MCIFARASDQSDSRTRRHASASDATPIAATRTHAATIAQGPTATARALLAGRERRIASRHARGSGRKGITF
eukprot:2971867-Pleurochrysis_carterae.AAC.1